MEYYDFYSPSTIINSNTKYNSNISSNINYNYNNWDIFNAQNYLSLKKNFKKIKN